MPGRAERIFRRAQARCDADGRLAMPPVGDWETFPFEGDMKVRELLPPVEREPPRRGEDAADCWRCARGDADAIWSDERWLLAPLERPSGLPVVVLLQPRAHCDLGDLPPETAAELGKMLVRAERAVASAGEIGRVHVCRWGDRSAHLHFWLMGRPSRLPQVSGSFCAIWDDILPPVPEDVWRADLATVARAMAAGGGRAHQP
jgi:diadenosine tetraphosphate (Ap4A) HIT family hydrolase